MKVGMCGLGKLGLPCALAMEEKGFNVIMYDPYIDDEKPRMDKGVYLIGVNHDIFVDYIFPVDSVVLDPWGYLPKQENINIIHIGR